MDSGWSRLGQAVGSLLVLTLFLLCPASAFAHKLNVFALAKGMSIEGRAYFPGDVPARKIDVIVRDAAGGELGRTTTDVDGNFTFTARKHVDHYLLAVTPDGHSGQYIVHASELPDSLPADVPAVSGGSQAAGDMPSRRPQRRARRTTLSAWEPNWPHFAFKSASSAGKFTNPTSVSAFATY